MLQIDALEKITIYFNGNDQDKLCIDSKCEPTFLKVSCFFFSYKMYFIGEGTNKQTNSLPKCVEVNECVSCRHAACSLSLFFAFESEQFVNST